MKILRSMTDVFFDIKSSVSWANPDRGTVVWKILILVLLTAAAFWNAKVLKANAHHPVLKIVSHVWNFWLLMFLAACFSPTSDFFFLSVLGLAAQIWPIIKKYLSEHKKEEDG